VKLRGKIPAIILGLPLEKSENPFLASPIGTLEADIHVDECSESKILVVGPESRVQPLLISFYDSLSQVLRGVCTRAEYKVEGPYTLAGLYSALTTLILHAIARHHGDTLDEWELVELARNADPIDKPSGWYYVLDALRYSVATGKIVVFRNDEEFAGLREAEPLQVDVYSDVGPLFQKLTREDVGPDPYNATVHLVGVTVLEGAVRVQEGSPIPEALQPLARILAGIANSYWGLPALEDNCIYSPGLPGRFDKLCFRPRK